VVIELGGCRKNKSLKKTELKKWERGGTEKMSKKLFAPESQKGKKKSAKTATPLI